MNVHYDPGLGRAATMDSLTLTTWVVAGLAGGVLLLCATVAGILLHNHCRRRGKGASGGFCRLEGRNLGEPFIEKKDGGFKMLQRGIHVTQTGNHVTQTGNSFTPSENHVTKAGNHVTFHRKNMAQNENHMPHPGSHVTNTGNHVIKTGNHAVQTGNHVIQTGNHEIQTGNKVIQTGKHVAQTGNHVVQTGNHVTQPGKCVIIKRNPVTETGRGEKQLVDKRWLEKSDSNKSIDVDFMTENCCLLNQVPGLDGRRTQSAWELSGRRKETRCYKCESSQLQLIFSRLPVSNRTSTATSVYFDAEEYEEDHVNGHVHHNGDNDADNGDSEYEDAVELAEDKEAKRMKWRMRALNQLHLQQFYRDQNQMEGDRSSRLHAAEICNKRQAAPDGGVT